MKQIIKTTMMLLLSATVFVACDNRNRADDSKDVAEDQNKERFDDRETRRDADFVVEAVAANMTEIQLAQLASQKSTNNEVKQIASMLEQDHNKSLSELQNLASRKGIAIPAALPDDAKRKVDNLREKSDQNEFNREWLKELEDKHDQSISDYEDRMENTEDEELRAWINSTLPHLRMHHDRIKATREKIRS